MSITAVLLPFVTYILTLPCTSRFDYGVPISMTVHVEADVATLVTQGRRDDMYSLSNLISLRH